MPASPEVTPLPFRNRRFVFLALLAVFALAMPVFVFYATGYRYTFFSDNPAIVPTGGMYVAADAENAEIFLNEEEVRSLRVFRQAAYIQSLTPGVHRLHVQAPELQTWVKELPVYPHIVTEASAFNLPERPQVRPIPAFVTVEGSAVYPGVASSTLPFGFASTTRPVLAATSTATSTYLANPEYDFVEALFATTTSTSSTLVGRVIREVESAFRFDTTPATGTVASTTSAAIAREDVRLFERDGEVYARYVGPLDETPYYFCVPRSSTASTTALYGAHVARGIAATLAGLDDELVGESATPRVCRQEIRIDRKGQTVLWFDFYPDSTDLVLMLLEDGLYVVEVDDRAWQNTQRLYPGEDLAVTVANGQIFIRDGDAYAEALTARITP